MTAGTTRARRPEVWGGVECTVHRVGDRYGDQLVATGHERRPEDLDRFAALGIRTLRYPVLWERTAPDGPERADWRWADERLTLLRSLGIRPIVGLVHHGSGPRGTDLLDPSFATGLAAFARAFAERHPWVEDYTPVNEPLTTARFACLYGHWYPHARDPLAFLRALLNQCRAVALSMKEIRRVNPAARLVQTEDLGRTHATPALQGQADFENERRWLTNDLLCGRVGEDHPLWRYLLDVGVSEAELEPFLAEPCPPDVLGFNHYVTSERFLDERLERYPAATHGGNGRVAYADVAAVRVLEEGAHGPYRLLLEAWERYRRPIAVTEAHLGGPPEEQVRWLHEVWCAATRLAEEGVPVRAVTVWSLLGAMDWDSLLTREDGSYEPGAFDARTDPPVATPLAQVVRDLCRQGASSHPDLAEPGWWRRPERLLYPAYALGPTAGAKAGPPVAASESRTEDAPRHGGPGPGRTADR